MDQVRAIAKVIWEQRFWVLSVLGLIVAIVCWNIASGALDAQFTTRKGAIETQFSAMSTLKSKAVHANDQVNTENQKQVEVQTEIVNSVWKSLYERQKASVLKWPKELGDQFITYIEGLKFRDPIAMNMRSIYQNYIGKSFDGLLDIVKAQKLGEGGMMGGGRGGYGGEYGGGERGGYGATAPAEADDDYLVQWVDQDKLRTKLQFATNKPTALQIWVTQEDIWVYQTLLNVIAKTNKARGATRPDNTAIHTIIALEVGAGAATGTALTGGMIFMPQAVGVEGGGMGGEMGGRGGEYMGGEMGGRGGEYMGGEMGGRGGEYMGEAGGDPAAMDAALLTNRYLDHATGAPLPGEGDLGLEYRQLPIRMDLIMDQRWLPRLLIECANSPLPIEVKQVRINPDKSMAGFAGGAGGSMGSMPGVTLPTDSAFSQIEIRGVVFIYNEPTAEPAADPAADLAVQQ